MDYTPTMFLHVGMHKTGTTALQKFFFDNRDAFIKEGLLYPSSGILDIGHHALVAALIDGDIPWMNLSVPKHQIIDDLNAELNEYPQHDVLLSAENFQRVSPQVIEELFAQRYVIRIVIYLRRQDKLFNSHYNQLLKARYETRSIHQVLASDTKFSKALSWLNFTQFIKPWEEVFGKDNLVVRIYENCQMKGSLHEDFLNAIGKRLPESVALPTEKVNPSLGRKAIELLRLSNHFPPIPEKHNYIELMAQWMKDLAPDGAPMLLAKSEIKLLLETFDIDNQIIARDYLGRKDGTLFYDEITLDCSDDRELTSKDLVNLLVRLWRYHLESLEACKKETAVCGNQQDKSGKILSVMTAKSLSKVNSAKELARRILMKFYRNKRL